MKEETKHAVIIIVGSLFATIMLYFALHNEAERVQKEQQRRSEMYKFIGDEENINNRSY